jgi:hypothetical protein
VASRRHQEGAGVRPAVDIDWKSLQAMIGQAAACGLSVPMKKA